MNFQPTISPRPLIVGIGGSTRAGSSSERALLAALEFANGQGCDTLAFAGPELLLPPYDPATAKSNATAIALIRALRRASGVIVSSPGYHGSISGTIKNTLDYVEEMRTDERPYFEGKVVGCIVCANGAQTMGTSLTTLRSIVHALRGWPTPYAATLETNALTSAIEAETWLPRLKLVVDQVTAFAKSDMSIFVHRDV